MIGGKINLAILKGGPKEANMPTETMWKDSEHPYTIAQNLKNKFDIASTDGAKQTKFDTWVKRKEKKIVELKEENEILGDDAGSISVATENNTEIKNIENELIEAKKKLVDTNKELVNAKKELETNIDLHKDLLAKFNGFFLEPFGYGNEGESLKKLVLIFEAYKLLGGRDADVDILISKQLVNLKKMIDEQIPGLTPDLADLQKKLNEEKEKNKTLLSLAIRNKNQIKFLQEEINELQKQIKGLQ